MSQKILLRARGLQTFENNLSEISDGALLIADNVVIDRDGVVEPRRGFPLYGEAMTLDGGIRAKQLLRYKGRILRHYDDILDFDNGSGDFTSFSGDYVEVETGVRIKGLEVNGNFYFTTNEGIKKISARSASDLSSASGFITNSGGIKAIDIEGTVNYTNPGFFLSKSKVAYRVVWGIKDANNNLILGSPSPRLVVTNPSTTMSGTVDLVINIPEGVTENHFYQVYRTAVKEAGILTLDEIDPEDEMYLVIEDFPDATDISNGFVEENDITPEDFRAGGTLLYTNPISGDGILQANEPPPLAQDIALFKNSVYYANTKTTHKQTISLLGVTDFVSGVTQFIISDGDNTTRYTFVGEQEITEFTFDTATNTAQSSYFILYAANDVRKYVVWFNKDGGGTQPAGIDTTGGIFVEVMITTGDTDAQVRGFAKTALDAADNGDFSFIELGAVLTVTATLNGNVTDAVAGIVPPGGAFAINVTQQGDGEDAGSQEVLLSNNASVAQAIDETARSLVRIINKQSNEIVYAYYLSGPDDIPGQFLLEAKTLEDSVFYVTVFDDTAPDNWNPTIPAINDITAITATNPTVVTSAAHGLSTGDQVVIAESNSVPDINGLWTVTVIDANNFSVPTSLLAGTPGTDGIWFSPTTKSDNEVAPNRIYFSKTQQPEAVPIVNFLDVGPKDQPINRILALRDSLFILKTDGVYRLTAEVGQTPVVTLFDSSALIRALDSAAILNNQIYMMSTQGITTISDTGLSIISRSIEDKVLQLASDAYTNFDTASWGISYESDRSYLFFTITDVDDEVAMQCFRYNTFTAAWVRWPISYTCGVIGSDDRLYMGSGETNFITKERKQFHRKDHADREYALQLTTNSFDSTGTVFKPSSIQNMETGDIIQQTQYLTLSEFRRLLNQLDTDVVLDDTDYSDLIVTQGGNIFNALSALVTKLNLDDTSRVSFNFAPGDVNTGTNTITVAAHGLADDTIIHFSSSGTLPGGLNATTAYYIINSTLNTFQVSLTEGGAAVDITSTGAGTHTVTTNYFYSANTDFATVQQEFNIIVAQLNSSAGVFFSNYPSSIDTVEYEAIVRNIETTVSIVTIDHAVPWMQGPLQLFKAIRCEIQYAPQTMTDASMLKQVREGTLMFEDTAFYGAIVSYRSDLSRNFQPIEFFLQGSGVWGPFEWNEIRWGGDGTTVPLRTIIPQQKQRCRHIDCKFTHAFAFNKFALYGLSLTYEMNSTRGYR